MTHTFIFPHSLSFLSSRPLLSASNLTFHQGSHHQTSHLSRSLNGTGESDLYFFNKIQWIIGYSRLHCLPSVLPSPESSLEHLHLLRLLPLWLKSCLNSNHDFQLPVGEFWVPSPEHSICTFSVPLTPMMMPQTHVSLSFLLPLIPSLSFLCF